MPIKLNRLKLLKQIRKLDIILEKEYSKRNIYKILIPRYNYNNNLIFNLEAEKRIIQGLLERLIS